MPIVQNFVTFVNRVFTNHEGTCTMSEENKRSEVQEVPEVRSQFRILLAQKEMRERRSISLREVVRDTGVAMSTVQGLANNTFKAISREALGQLCAYLGCDVGELLMVDRSLRQQAA